MFSESKLLEAFKNLATKLKKFWVVTLLSGGLLLNGTFSVGDLTIGYEYQHEQEVQQNVQENVKNKVAKLPRKANNQL